MLGVLRVFGPGLVPPSYEAVVRKEEGRKRKKNEIAHLAFELGGFFALALASAKAGG